MAFHVYRLAFMSASVETIRLPRVLVEIIRRRAEKEGVQVEEYVVDALTQGFDPKESAEVYMDASRSLFEQAKEELEKGDLRQAAEKLWGAAALAVKAYAMHREGRRLTSHRELWEYSRRIAEELGRWVHYSWMIANTMHTCFHEGWCASEHVEVALESVGRLVEEIGRRLQAEKS